MECRVFGFFFFFFKQKTAYEMLRSLVGSEMCIRDRGYCAPGIRPRGTGWDRFRRNRTSCGASFCWPNDRAGQRPRQEPHFGNKCRGTGQNRRQPITNSLKAPTITPYFRQSSVTLGWDKASVASKARSGSSSGFLSPPAPRGSADRAKLSFAYGSIP